MKDKVFNAVMLFTPVPINKSDLFIVWSCYILGNRKFLVGCKFTDNYFEVTYNSIKQEWYIDIYEKLNNNCITNKLLEEYTDANNTNN